VGVPSLGGDPRRVDCFGVQRLPLLRFSVSVDAVNVVFFHFVLSSVIGSRNVENLKEWVRAVYFVSIFAVMG
jgi:hypothetical protein